MTKEEKEKIQGLHDAGLAHQEIANELGISRDSVIGILKRNKQAQAFYSNHCLICKKEFEDRSRGIKHKYCSDRCRYLAWKEKHKGETRKRTKKSICLYCGKEFFGYSNKHQKFCSLSCAARYQHECK